MKRSVPILIVLLLTCVGSAFAQIAVRGSVRDAETGDTLPGATVQIEGALQGSVTNENGRFSITLNRIPAVLVVRHIGFRTKRISIEEILAGELLVALEAVAFELDELVVSGEDPAVEIMREVLIRKRDFRALYETAYAEVYTRFWLFREFDPIQVIESIRSSYWRDGEGNRELVRARRVRPSGSGTFLFAEPGYVPNFYDDEVTLNETTYPTPTHPDALSIYRFRLGGNRRIDDSVVWDIYFTPRSLTNTAFTGHVAVIDSLFEILEIDVRPHPATVVVPPVRLHDVQYAQRFVHLASNIVVPLDLTANGYVSFGQLGANYVPARYEQTSSISNYSIEVPVPDSMFTDARTQRDHPLVTRSDYLFVSNPTVVPLAPREMEAVAKLNPAITVERAFQPSGLLGRYTAVRVTEPEEEDEPSSSPVAFVIQNSWTWYNRVDGFHPGINYQTSIGPTINMGGRLGYAVKQQRLSAGADVSLPMTGSRFSGDIYLEGSTHTVPIARGSAYDIVVPGFMTYLGYDDYFDFYRRDRLRLGGSIQPSEFPLALRVAGNLENHSSLKKESNFSGWLFTNEQRGNPTIEDGRLASVELGLSGGGEQMGVEISMERAIAGTFSSDFKFSTVWGSAFLQTPTFFRRRERPNQLQIRIVGTTSHGSLPIQRYAMLDGSTGFYARRASFRTLRDQPILGRKLGAVFWEHDFTTVLAEWIGLWGMAEMGTGVILFGGHGKVWTPFGTHGGYSLVHELGVGIAYPFRLPLRIDFAARLDEQEFAITIGKVTLK